MSTHIPDTYRDGHKWVIYCKVCGQENPVESSECPGQYIRNNRVDKDKK